jgi:hypothetical protein
MVEKYHSNLLLFESWNQILSKFIAAGGEAVR